MTHSERTADPLSSFNYAEIAREIIRTVQPEVVIGGGYPGSVGGASVGFKYLSRNREGFFVMIEQCDIDWANHADDFRRMIGTVRDLHEPVQKAIDFIDRVK